MTNLESEDLKFMRLALAEAARGLAVGEMPIGAVLVCNGKIIASRYCDETHHGMLGHAELLAILDAEKLKPSFQERKRTTLYSTLEPCLMCAGAAMAYFASRIVYSLHAPGDGVTSTLETFQSKDSSFQNFQVPAILGGIFADEAKKQMESYASISQSSARVRYALGVIKAN